ncbi:MULTISPECIES: DnaJ domain-containing protein [unclassified Microbacterium]|uniref:DnaJ domain-containing protein n=1 Tax=unclassified Microbacterium TaxID=2609290 RepID=UPI000EA9F257|nr:MULTISPECIES: DnaJ domain-containing protein [unclassified Microbacterium]MBT2483941.1 DnaJ domain-containing protein [Microbacterium sp. ISL-108]RKN66910.1 molecular chaperone DnaJ [Microbacterium sp. CGR2]
MFDSPLSASAYEILEVDPAVDDAALRRAYRLRLRQTHPDTGGDAAVFIQVQRAWELVGTPEGRAAYDRRTGVTADSQWSGWRPPAARADTRPRARSYGHPGGWRRERYLMLIREWAGRGVEVPDPYDPALVRAAPRELRRMLADALAEEATARTVSDLGMGFTVWHDVVAGPDADDKLDHVVLGPSGLYGVMSEDFGGVVGFRRGEITGPSLGTRAPVTTALARMRVVARAAKVRFGGAIIVLPDDDLAQAVTPLGSIRGVPVVVVRRSALSRVLRTGVPRARAIGGNELFDVRTRLQQTVRFV